MRRRLAKEASPYATVHFVFTIKDGMPVEESFYWEDDHEFHYRGSMYDVIKKEVIANQLYITCIEDGHEQKLVDMLTAHTSSQHGQKGNIQHTASQLILLVFLGTDNYISNSIVSEMTLKISPYSMFAPDWCGDILLPPPRS